MKQIDFYEGMEINLLVDKYEMRSGRYLVVNTRYPTMILRRLNKNGDIRKNGPRRYLLKVIVQQDLKNGMMVLEQEED